MLVSLAGWRAPAGPRGGNFGGDVLQHASCLPACRYGVRYPTLYARCAARSPVQQQARSPQPAACPHSTPATAAACVRRSSRCMRSLPACTHARTHARARAHAARTTAARTPRSRTSTTASSAATRTAWSSSPPSTRSSAWPVRQQQAQMAPPGAWHAHMAERTLGLPATSRAALPHHRGAGRLHVAAGPVHVLQGAHAALQATVTPNDRPKLSTRSALRTASACSRALNLTALACALQGYATGVPKYRLYGAVGYFGGCEGGARGWVGACVSVRGSGPACGHTCAAAALNNFTPCPPRTLCRRHVHTGRLHDQDGCRPAPEVDTAVCDMQ